jgi:hypothetical protein
VRTVGSEAQTGERVTPPARDRVRARALWIAGTLAAAVVLMLAYLAAAGTVPVLSDGAGNALQAWDMLHGNLLLHGWWVTDVSFYTTELPQYMLIEAFGGLRTEVVHIAARAGRKGLSARCSPPGSCSRRSRWRPPGS